MLICVMIASTLALLSSCDNPDTGQTTASDTGGQEQPSELTDGRTLFIYMCGSNLETKQGLAGKNIDEILTADAGDLNIVIQTGGAKTWRSFEIDSTAAQRYEVKNGELVLLDTLSQLNMGESETLTDFLKWGQEKYHTKNNMLILWDHGGGSAKGVCFDENYGFDGLTLIELKTALENAGLYTKFDIIGFDACLMASLETAYLVQDFARYMIASEEIEPSGGWDYKVLAESFLTKDDCVKTGKAICDAYIRKCKGNGKLYATLSLFDLSHTNDMLDQYSAAVEAIDNYVDNADYSFSVMEALNTCEKFGGDNSYQGASNMLDYLDFMSKITEAGSDELGGLQIDASNFVLYSVSCGGRTNGGVSFYYPLVYNEKEIRDYISLGMSEYYNEFLKAYYLNIPDLTVEYADKGSIADDGAFTVTLTPGSFNYLSHVDFLLMYTDGVGERHILCTDNDMNKNWDKLIFKSNFRGITLALDGHAMFYSTVASNSNYVSFIAPVRVNGQRTNLRFVFVWDDSYFNGGYYMLAGIWNGYDENGLPDNDIIPLQIGDTVQVLTDTVFKSGRYIETWSEEIIIGEDGGKISEIPLKERVYQYAFIATDIFGNTFVSDMATFEMKYTYEELLENPLPDGEYAAKVTEIGPYHAD